MSKKDFPSKFCKSQEQDIDIVICKETTGEGFSSSCPYGNVSDAEEFCRFYKDVNEPDKEPTPNNEGEVQSSTQ